MKKKKKKKERMDYNCTIPNPELAALNISIVFRAWGRPLNFSSCTIFITLKLMKMKQNYYQHVNKIKCFIKGQIYWL